MFEITGSDIAALSDGDLRELVALLCEADLRIAGISASSVTWGGDQRAADGGVDVRVELADGQAPVGFIPRASTVLQVKAEDLPRASIINEMRPGGVLRTSIQDVAARSGAYIIASSRGSVADQALIDRRNAMREALNDLAEAGRLHTDFFDRNRVATWVRTHPGMVVWVRNRVGRSIQGWQAYGPWAYAAEGMDAQFLADQQARLIDESRIEDGPLVIVDGIERIRGLLARDHASVRLVGLSGVGKTRLVQALFDDRVGGSALPRHEAIYTNLSDDPNPQPMALASQLIAARARAVLIVDNCPPELHSRLTEVINSPASRLSILTIEYDVRDDRPEQTKVFRLEPSSREFLRDLLRYRFPLLSQLDAERIAELSGGNSRIALLLASTPSEGRATSQLTSAEIFRRLFQQGHEVDDKLRQTAETCSLVHSFHGEKLVGTDAELPILASLAGLSPSELYGYVSELMRRDLIQKRNVWRAVLPHALANRLASAALENIPHANIEHALHQQGVERLFRSFSRRLSYLHDCGPAVEIVRRWLAPGGILGNIGELNESSRALLGRVDKQDSQISLVLIQGSFGGSYRDPRFDERQGMGLS